MAAVVTTGVALLAAVASAAATAAPRRKRDGAAPEDDDEDDDKHDHKSPEHDLHSPLVNRRMTTPTHVPLGESAALECLKVADPR